VPSGRRHLLAPPVSLAALATLAALALAAPGVPAADATAQPPVPRTSVTPASLERGADPAVPQVLDTTIIDGERRIRVPAREIALLGTSGGDYVVAAWSDRGGRVQRVATDGDRETILDRIPGEVTLSVDGRLLFHTALREDDRTVVTARDARTGERVARRAFRGYLWVLDADHGRVLLGGTAPARTLWWNVRSGSTRTIARREGYFADIRADRLAVFTASPYDGGCSVVSALAPPREPLWRSCRQAVVAASPDGHRLLTAHILADGPNPLLRVHRDRGRHLATYRTPGRFGAATWETARSVLVLTYGTTKTAIVRCEGDSCERASERVDSWG
jgi:hypothetical protein